MNYTLGKTAVKIVTFTLALTVILFKASVESLGIYDNS